jgi:hypothetical protein
MRCGAVAERSLMGDRFGLVAADEAAEAEGARLPLAGENQHHDAGALDELEAHPVRLVRVRIKRQDDIGRRQDFAQLAFEIRARKAVELGACCFGDRQEFCDQIVEFIAATHRSSRTKRGRANVPGRGTASAVPAPHRRAYPRHFR